MKTQTAKEFIKDYGILSVVAFFFTAFYYDTKGYGEELKQISQNTAVMASQLITFGQDLAENTEKDKEQDKEIKKLGKGLAVLETRVDIIERR